MAIKNLELANCTECEVYPSTERYKDEDGWHFKVYCPECGKASFYTPTIVEAGMAWNTANNQAPPSDITKPKPKAKDKAGQEFPASDLADGWWTQDYFAKPINGRTLYQYVKEAKNGKVAFTYDGTPYWRYLEPDSMLVLVDNAD